MYGDSYAGMLYQTRTTSDGSSGSVQVGMTSDEFMQLPGNMRRAIYDTIALDLLDDDPKTEVSISQMEILSYGIQFEDQIQYAPSMMDSGDYGEWMQNFNAVNPSDFDYMTQVIEANEEWYKDADENPSNHKLQLAAEVLAWGAAAAGVAVVTGVGIELATMAVPAAVTFAVGATTTVSMLQYSESLAVRVGYWGGKLAFMSGILGPAASLYHRLSDPEKVAEEQRNAREDAQKELNQEELQSAGLLLPGVYALGAEDSVQQVRETATLDGAPGAGDLEDIEMPGSGGATTTDDTTTVPELDMPDDVPESRRWRSLASGETASTVVAKPTPDFNFPEIPTTVNMRQAGDGQLLYGSYNGPEKWDAGIASAHSRGELTYGTPGKPIPTASAMEWSEAYAGKPGHYAVRPDRQNYLTSRNAALQAQWTQAQYGAVPDNVGASDIEEGPLTTGIPDGGMGYQTYMPSPLSPGYQAPKEEYYWMPDDLAAKWIDNYGNTIWREPRYLKSQNDAWSALRNVSTTELEVLQSDWLDAGWIDPSYLPGMKDMKTYKALEMSMGAANVEGRWWKDVSAQAGRVGRANKPSRGRYGGGGGYVRPPFVKRTYIKPDYEEMAQVSKRAVRQYLKRDPHTWEVKMIADKFAEEHKRKFDVEEDVRWKDYQRGTGGNKLTSETVDGVIDPGAVTQNWFERQWAPELDRRDKVEAQRHGAERFLNSMLQTDQRIMSARSEGSTQKVGE